MESTSNTGTESLTLTPFAYVLPVNIWNVHVLQGQNH
jgi:hypothetical protein